MIIKSVNDPLSSFEKIIAFLRVSVFSFIFSGKLGLINFGLDLDHYHIHPIYFGISSFGRSLSILH